MVEMGNYSINRENHDNLASNNHIVTIILAFNNRKLQQPYVFHEILKVQSTTELNKYILELLFVGARSTSIYTDNNRDNRDI